MGDKQFSKTIRGKINIAPDSKIEQRQVGPMGATVGIVKPKLGSLNSEELRRTARMLQKYKKFWRRANDGTTWKECRKEVLGLYSFNDAFCDALSMTRTFGNFRGFR